MVYEYKAILSKNVCFERMKGANPHSAGGSTNLVATGFNPLTNRRAWFSAVGTAHIILAEPTVLDRGVCFQWIKIRCYKIVHGYATQKIDFTSYSPFRGPGAINTSPIAFSLTPSATWGLMLHRLYRWFGLARTFRYVTHQPTK